MNTHIQKQTIAVVGLGYVGLPLAVAFAKAGFRVVGYDVSASRITELVQGKDRTGEVEPRLLRQKTLTYTSDATALRVADFVIVAVPTPVFETKKPDLRPLESASQTVGKNLKRGAIVVYESTVWPGLTEEYCVPIIEKFSRKRCGKEFFVAYSPERINPGDKQHSLQNMMKVVSAVDVRTLDKVASLYKTICKAGVFKAASIKVAEAAKAIENTQRDLNIALMNELAILFKRLDIPMREVLETASTKWNFGRYTPGLVGGHCIPVDPYYLTTLAQKVGYNPKVILAGREINDAMPKYVVKLLEEGMSETHSKKLVPEHVEGHANAKENPSTPVGRSGNKRVLVLGLTFKENVPDTRNSPARELVRILQEKGYAVFAYDPHVSREDTIRRFKVAYTPWPPKQKYDGIIITVAHREFLKLSPARIKKLLKGKEGRARHSLLVHRSFSEGGSDGGVLVDIRGIFAKHPPKGIVYTTL